MGEIGQRREAHMDRGISRERRARAASRSAGRVARAARRDHRRGERSNAGHGAVRGRLRTRLAGRLVRGQRARTRRGPGAAGRSAGGRYGGPDGSVRLGGGEDLARCHGGRTPSGGFPPLLRAARPPGALVADPRIAGIAFTGSTITARAIQRVLAEREGPIAPLIAETGGLNAMIVDSSALPEQVVDAVVASAFRSAGQRCSSLRVLYLQEEIAPAVLDMLRGAMATLRIGDPADPATDVGPVIDAQARKELAEYISDLRSRAKLIAESGPVPAAGSYVAPVAFEIGSIREVPGERFGPILHVARFPLEDLDRVVDDINATGYGLTMGVHTRVDSRAERIRARSAVGNLYVNRNMIGAVVGVQPFGGEGLSGTGPKAGGPNYLVRFTTERVFTVNTAAAGGDLGLLAGTTAAT